MTFHWNSDICDVCGGKLYLAGGGTGCSCGEASSESAPFFEGTPTEYMESYVFKSGLDGIEARVMGLVSKGDADDVVLALPDAGLIGFYRPRVMRNIMFSCRKRGIDLRGLICGRVFEALHDLMSGPDEWLGMHIKLAQGVFLARAQFNFYNHDRHPEAGVTANLLKHKVRYAVPNPDMVDYLRDFQGDMQFPEHDFIFGKVIEPDVLGHDPKMREMFEAVVDAL
jgi:hypothetical protein